MTEITCQRGIATGRLHPGTVGGIISECLGDIIGIGTNRR